MKKQLVKLTYFKQSGKYYSTGEMEVPADWPMFKIFDEVSRLISIGSLPGLMQGSHGFHVLCEVPGHKHEYPGLFPAL